MNSLCPRAPHQSAKHVLSVLVFEKLFVLLISLLISGGFHSPGLVGHGFFCFVKLISLFHLLYPLFIGSSCYELPRFTSTLSYNQHNPSTNP